MSEIAAAAGLSRTTVSFILNNKPQAEKFPENTRKKVLDAAKKLGYVPNRMAQAMITGNSRVVIFICGTNFSKLVIGEEFEGLYNALLAKGYYLHPMALGDSKEDLERSILEKTPMAIVTRGGHIAKQMESFCENHSFPLVVFDSSQSVNYGHRVTTDDGIGMAQAVDHLLNLGHRQFGFIAGTKGKNDMASNIRLQLASAELSGHDLEIDPSHVVSTSYDWDKALDSAKAYLDKTPLEKLPTAFLSASDIPAAAMLNALEARGIRVPDRVSIVGFGDLYHAQVTRPALSSINQGFQEMGSVAGERIYEFIEMKLKEKPFPSGRTDLLPTVFVQRDSTGAAPQSL